MCPRHANTTKNGPIKVSFLKEEIINDHFASKILETLETRVLSHYLHDYISILFHITVIDDVGKFSLNGCVVIGEPKFQRDGLPTLFLIN